MVVGARDDVAMMRASPPTKLLLISNDVIASTMAGSGARNWEIARALSRFASVTLATPTPSDRRTSEFALVSYGCDEGNPAASQSIVADLLDRCDVALISGRALVTFPFLGSSPKPLIVDLYCPYFFENLEWWKDTSTGHRLENHQDGLRVLQGLLRRGDFFLGASSTQRDLLLGMLMATGRVDPLIYERDPALQRFVAVVPFGLPARAPRHPRPVLKGVYPGIGENDLVVLWGGGIWQWLDPLTIIRAVGRVAERLPRIKLFFMGTRISQNSTVPVMEIVRDAMDLSRQLDLLGKHVFFNDWVPYDERDGYLLEADLGVSLHVESVESRFAFRTRTLDYIWAGLPMVLTRGDYLADVVDGRGLGTLVGPSDVDGVASAITTMLSSPGLRASLAPRFAEVAAELTWDRAVQPLARFLADPRPAPRAATDACATRDAAAGQASDEIERLRQELRERESEVAQLRAHLAAVERGRVMRLLNSLHRARK